MRLDDEAVALYWNSRIAFLQGNIPRATEFYRQLRANHGCDLFYEVELPAHLLLVHPVGLVLGRATYGDYFAAYNCSGVGSDLDGNRPVIGEGVVLFPGARVLGNTTIGKNVFITANTVVQNLDVPDNCIVFSAIHSLYDIDPAAGESAPITVNWKTTTRNVKRDIFKVAP